jgi:hypothetical protein
MTRFRGRMRSPNSSLGMAIARLGSPRQDLTADRISQALALSGWNGRMYFTSGPGTRKSRNLKYNPACAISVSLPDLHLVIEGRAVRVNDASTLQRLADPIRFKGGQRAPSMARSLPRLARRAPGRHSGVCMRFRRRLPWALQPESRTELHAGDSIESGGYRIGRVSRPLVRYPCRCRAVGRGTSRGHAGALGQRRAGCPYTGVVPGSSSFLAAQRHPGNYRTVAIGRLAYPQAARHLPRALVVQQGPMLVVLDEHGGNLPGGDRTISHSYRECSGSERTHPGLCRVPRDGLGACQSKACTNGSEAITR